MIRTMGIREAESYSTGDPDWHVISIRSEGNRFADLAHGWGQVTFVTLADVGIRNDPAEILRVAQALENAVTAGKHIIVHCEMGVSRSVGVAYAAAEHFGLDYRHLHYGNSALKKEVLEALRSRAGHHATR